MASDVDFPFCSNLKLIMSHAVRMVNIHDTIQPFQVLQTAMIGMRGMSCDVGDLLSELSLGSKVVGEEPESLMEC